jgi:hypothetical protein
MPVTTNGYELARTHSTYAGVDIKMLLGGSVLGNAQAISYAVQREKAPLNVLGRVDPIAFSRGKRGIAGTLVALLLEEHLLYSALGNTRFFVADKDEIRPETRNSMNDANANGLESTAAVGAFEADNVSGNYEVVAAWMIDQLLPQDAALVAQNEYGAQAQMRIFGIEFLNEGGGVSVDDRTMETQHTFVARSLMPWRRVGRFGAPNAPLTEGMSFTPRT